MELVVVEFTPVKFCKVVEPVARIVFDVNIPVTALVALKLVEDALVAKRFVDVAFVVVAFVNWAVGLTMSDRRN